MISNMSQNPCKLHEFGQTLECFLKTWSPTYHKTIVNYMTFGRQLVIQTKTAMKQWWHSCRTECRSDLQWYWTASYSSQATHPWICNDVCRLSCNPSLGQAQTSIMTLQSPMINEWAEHELMSRVRIWHKESRSWNFKKKKNDQVAVKAYANRVSKFWQNAKPQKIETSTTQSLRSKTTKIRISGQTTKI